MITAVDTNVLLDVFVDGREHRDASVRTLGRCIEEGQLIVCDVVVAELTASANALNIEELLDISRTRYVPLDEEAAIEAGRRWSIHRRATGDRSRVAADFLIGGHAVVHADRLLTRDRGFYREAFNGLTVIAP